MSSRGGVLLLVALVACNDDETSPGNTVLPGAQCPPGERLVGEQCIAAGVQDDGCAAGELGIEGGGCQPAGIPACAEGFVATMDRSCEPVLPSGTCTRGLM